MELEKSGLDKLFKLIKKNVKDYLIHHDVGLCLSHLKRMRHNELYNNETGNNVESWRRP